MNRLSTIGGIKIKITLSKILWAFFVGVILVLLGYFIHDYATSQEPSNYIDFSDRCKAIGLNEFEGMLKGAYKFTLENLGYTTSYGTINITMDKFDFIDTNKSHNSFDYSLSISNNPDRPYGYPIDKKIKLIDEYAENATIKVSITCKKKIWFWKFNCEKPLLEYICYYERQARLLFVSVD